MVSLPPQRQIIHIIPQEFVIDDQSGIRDPKGMAGVRLETKVHLITASIAAVQTLIRCIQRAGLDIIEILFQPLAASEAVLTNEERALGVLLLDLGGGTTETIVFGDNCIKHSAILAVGGEAERVKLKYGTAITTLLERDEEIEMTTLAGKKSAKVPRSFLAKIIQPRVEEILYLIEKEITNSNLKDMLASGIVITGGSSLLPGLVELSEHIFDLPTKVGYPRGVNGLSEIIHNPIYAAALGLVKHGVRSQKGEGYRGFRKQSIWQNFINSFKKWFKEAF
jgi:cell division protein FtsA